MIGALMTTAEVEIAVANFLDPRRYLIVPNVWWGMGLNHECDIFAVSRTGYVTEVEIKVNRYDLKRDRLKHHAHGSKLIKRLFFAIPESLIQVIQFVPEDAGVIVVNETEWAGTCRLRRSATINKMARPLSEKELNHLGRLAAMRIWSLKRALSNRGNNADQFIITYEERRRE
jgi:hypothetical protein